MGLYRTKRCNSSDQIANLSLVADPTVPSKIRCPTCNQNVQLFKDNRGRYLVIERHNSFTHRQGSWDHHERIEQS